MDEQAQRDTENQISIAEKGVSINERTEKFYEEQYESRFTFDESKYGTKQGAKIAKINFESRRDGFIAGRQIKNSELAIKGSIQLTEQNYITEPTPENRIKYEQALSLQDSKDAVEAKLDVADVAAAKTIKDRALGVTTAAAFSTWQSTVTEDDPDGDLNAAFKVIEDSNIPPEDKQEAESELKTRVTNRRAEDKLNLEAATKESIEAINGEINKGNFEGINIFIDAQPITETEKVKQKETASDYITSVRNFNTSANFVTSDETNITIDRIIRRTRSGDLSYDDAIKEYRKVSKDVKSTEGKTNLDNISSAVTISENVDEKRKSGDYDSRARQLRDSIERQTSLLLEPDEIDEVLVDLANKAELELAGKFDGVNYEKQDLVDEINRLMRKYTLSEAQMTRAVTARRLRLAESFEEQQEEIINSIRQLTEDGKRSEAKAVMEEAISLGFDLTEEGKAKSKEKKSKKSGISRIVNRLLGRD
jgi:hypothetical protein